MGLDVFPFWGIGLEMKTFWIFVLLGSAGIAMVSQSGWAQQPQGNQQTPPLQQAGSQAATASLPDAYRLNMMIRSSIIALNQANKTGNYTVLLDLASPSFRASNDSNRLAQIFAKLRQRNLDLSPILFFTPKLIRQPQIAPNGLLRLVGYFPTAPERVNFDLYFQMVGDEWRMFGIGVDMSAADVTASVSNEQNNNLRARKDIPERVQTQSEENTGDNRPATVANAPLPERKPNNYKHPSGNNNGDKTQTAVENRTTNNATRIDLSQPAPNDTGNEGTTDSGTSLWESLNPFSSD